MCLRFRLVMSLLLRRLLCRLRLRLRLRRRRRLVCRLLSVVLSAVHRMRVDIRNSYCIIGSIDILISPAFSTPAAARRVLSWLVGLGPLGASEMSAQYPCTN